MSSRDKTPEFTLRGRALDTALPEKPRKRDNPLGTAIMGRKRSNSIRRLPITTLQTLTRHKDDHVTQAAVRELGVRQDIVDASKHQFRNREHPEMNAMGPATMRDASAVRFAASMAEEAQDEIVREDIAQKKNPQQVGQIGVASVRGHIGVGFSGKSSEMEHTRRVERRMLELQEHYDKSDESHHWSGRLKEVAVTDVFAKDGGNVCAAKRAAHVTHSLVLGPEAPTKPVGRDVIPPPDSLVEMMSPAMSGRGNLLSNYSVPNTSLPDPVGPLTVAGRQRRDSVSSMANSCETCMAEHEQHISKRSGK